MLKNDRSLKILILCAYFNRPKLIRNALLSIAEAGQHYSNWHLVFGDDGSTIPGRPIVEEILKDHLDQISFVESNMTFEDKIKAGLLLGKYANEIMKQSDADIAFMLCDDDELHPMYLVNLNNFFNQNPKVLYCYSKISLYNPFFPKSKEIESVIGRYNSWTEPIDPVGHVDASQVAWRLICCKKYEAWFADSTRFIEGKPWTKDTDRGFFENLSKNCGLCYPTGFIGQYKGIHDYQLLWHKDVPAASLWAYDQMCKNLAGVEF